MIVSAFPMSLADTPRDDGARAVPRAVLGELFTATWCQYCPGADGAFDRFVNNASLFPGRFTAIEWHPNDGSDVYGNADTQSRHNYYGVNSWPNAIFDGISAVPGGSTDPNSTAMDTAYMSKINARPATSPIKLELDAKIVNGQVTYAGVNVTALDSVASYGNLKVVAVVVEDLQLTMPNKGFLGWTARDTLISTSLAISQGQTKKVEGTGNYDSSWNIADLGVVAFVQSDTSREILQSIIAIGMPQVTNSPPAVASNPVTSVSFAEDTVYTSLDLNAMFTDPEADKLTFTFSGASKINVTIFDGKANLTPQKEWSGVETIRFTAQDWFNPNILSNDVQATVTALNDKPFVIKGIGDFSMIEGSEKVGVKLDDIFGDIDSVLTYSFSGNSKINVSIDKTSHVVTYTAPDFFVGKETIKFTASDGQYDVWTTVNVTVVHINHPPVAKAIPNIEMPENGVDTSLDLGKIFSDPDGFNTLSFTSEDAGGHITITIDADNKVTLKPLPYWNGKEMVVFTTTDGMADAVSATVNVTVTPVNYAPELVGGLEKIILDEDSNYATTKTLKSCFRDPEGDLLTYSVDFEPASITVEINPDSTVTFTPVKDFFGQLKVTFHATDTGGLEARYICNVTVNNIQDAPVIRTAAPSTAKSITMNEGETKTFNITAFDIDQEPLEYTWNLDSKVQDADSDSFEHTANFNSAGTHKLTVVVTDGKDVAELTWTIKVVNVNRIPSGSIASPVNLASFSSGAQIRFQAAASDPDGDKLTYRWLSDGVEIGNLADFSRTLPSGTHKIVLEVSDGTEKVTTTDVSITVKKAPSKETPGFEGVLLVAGLAVALAILGRRK